jgi:hypothetical protein
MKLNRMLPPIYRWTLGAIILGSTAGSPAIAQANKAKTVPGEIILFMQPGVPKADVQKLAATVNPSSFTALQMQDCYVLELPDAKRTDNDTAAAVASLKADARVRNVRASLIFRAKQVGGTPPISEPNDPRYKSGEQWGLKLINMPQAWALQKGAAGVKLGWIDSGFDPKHEDAIGQFDPASFDFADNDSDITADGPGGPGEFDHGTGTSGVAFALTDNSIGIAGVCWQNIKCVALKVVKKGTGTAPPPFDEPGILNSYAFLLANHVKLNVVAVNLSFGADGGDPNNTADPEFVATKALTDAGVLVIASSGNSGLNGNPPSTPADFAHVISVSALDRNGKVTGYSSTGKVELAAPGGDAGETGVPANGILVLNQNSAYSFEDGTSFAAPHVTGVAGLMMSVPGVTPAIAKAAMFSTANHAGLGALPDPKFGFGILDAGAALALVSVQVLITAPEGVNAVGQSSDPSNIVPPPVETFKPQVSFHFNNVPCDQVKFNVDTSIPSIAKSFTLAQLISGPLPPGVSDFVISGPCSGVSNPNYDVSFRLELPTTGFFQHNVTVSGTDPNSGITRTDTRLFSVAPHNIPPGLSMVSFPYFEAPSDAPAPFTGTFRDVTQLLGSAPSLYRYLVPAEVATQTGDVVDGAYAKFAATDPKANVNATFHPLDTLPAITPAPSGSNGLPLDTRPLGLGYFINTPVAIPVITFGTAFITSSFKIPLHEGWNIIGDPYPFAVPFNSTEIETSTGTREPVAQAVDQNLILPNIFRFVNGDYQFASLPDGALQPWEGHWVFVIPKDPLHQNPATVLSLIVTPTPGGASSATGRAAVRPVVNTTLTRVIGGGSWKLQIEAHVGDKSDSNNYIGMSGNATDGNDRTKVAKPPKLDNSVNLSIVRPNSPATVYAQDLRSLGGTKQWNIVVSTDKPNANVTMEWPNARSLPKTYSLILTDQVSGTSLDVRNSSSYQFNSGTTPGTRSFTLVARPNAGIGGHPVFTNIGVNPGRSGGRAANVYNITYNLSGSASVSVSILTAGGHPVAQLVTRAVTAGDNSLTWNGLDNSGRPVAAGSYVLQFQAATNDGQTTRVIRPLILSGRSQ